VRLLQSLAAVALGFALVDGIRQQGGNVWGTLALIAIAGLLVIGDRSRRS